MTKSPHRTLALATVSLMTAACTSATAGTYAENNVTEIDQKETLSSPVQNRRHHNRVKSHKIAEQAMRAAQNALEEALTTLQKIHIDEDALKRDVQHTVRLALIEAEADLKDMEIEFKEFNDENLEHDLEDMRHGLQRAVEEEHLTKQEMDRILEAVEKSREEALAEVRESLEEISAALQELHEETRSAKDN